MRRRTFMTGIAASLAAAARPRVSRAQAGMMLTEPDDTGCLDVPASIIDEAASTLYLKPRLTWTNKWTGYFGILDGALGRSPIVELDMTTCLYAMNGAFRWGVWAYHPAGPWKTWDAVNFFTAPNRIRLTKVAPFIHDRVYLALYPPYTAADLAADMERWTADPFITPTISGGGGFSVASLPAIDNGFGRLCPAADLWAFVLEDTGQPGPKNVGLLVNGIHPGEWVGSWVFQAFVDFLKSDDPEAVYLRRAWKWIVFAHANPQGLYGGLSRSAPDALTVDFNREFNLSTPASPTLAALRAAMRASAPASVHFAADFHCYHQSQSNATGGHIANAYAPMNATTRKHAQFSAAVKLNMSGTWAWSLWPSAGYIGTFNKWAQANKDAGASLQVCATIEVGPKSDFVMVDLTRYAHGAARAVADMTAAGHFPVTP